jgi:hypothetical protein
VEPPATTLMVTSPPDTTQILLFDSSKGPIITWKNWNLCRDASILYYIQYPILRIYIGMNHLFPISLFILIHPRLFLNKGSHIWRRRTSGSKQATALLLPGATGLQ